MEYVVLIIVIVALGWRLVSGRSGIGPDDCKD